MVSARALGRLGRLGACAARAGTPGASAPALPPFAVQSLLLSSSRSLHSSASFLTAAQPVPAPHPGLKAKQAAEEYMLMNPIYTAEELKVTPHHRPIESTRDRISYALVWLARKSFDAVTGYKPDGVMTERQWLNRFIFLETVAAIPGMVGGAVRHLHSLRLMRRDMGWIHTLLEEAENERMHLLTFIQLRQPGPLFRGAVLVTQGVVFNLFFLSYLLSPKTCHRFVGYLEEEAVRTYTHAITDLAAGRIPEWQALAAPPIAVEYWKLRKGADMNDLLLAVRADEACHSHVNHTLSSLAEGAKNPFTKGHTAVPEDFTRPPPGIDLKTGAVA